MNSDYGGNLDGGMPITWYVFILVDESLCWKFIVTMSTTKIDYMVIVKASKGVHFPKYLRDGVCSKRNNGGGLFCGGNRHCHWRHG